MQDKELEDKEDIKTGLMNEKEDIKHIGILADFKKIHDSQQILKRKEVEYER